MATIEEEGVINWVRRRARAIGRASVLVAALATAGAAEDAPTFTFAGLKLLPTRRDKAADFAKLAT